MERIHGRVAVVTGAASGIGLGICKALAAEGAHVAMVDVEEGALADAHAAINQANVDVQRYVADVSDRNQMAATAAAVVAHFGKVHILCNNAGVAAGGVFGEISYADWDWVLGVNLNGVINGMQTFVPIIKAAGEGGHIVNTSSILGLVTGARRAVYSASKYAVLAISEAAREDLAPASIGVSALCPGMIATQILQSARNRPADHDAPSPIVDPGAQREVEARFATEGLHPDRVGEQVVHGIRHDKPYIFTHAGLRQGIEARMRAILDSFDGTEA